jgi:hypothetical protein
MATSADSLKPGGISWEEAMENAAAILGQLKPPSKWTQFAAWQEKSGAAQAWIAYAREITMHARATQ